MKKQTYRFAIGISLLAASTAVLAQAKPEDMIRWRQSAYQTMAWSMGRIKANVEGATYNKDQVVQAANTLQALANSGMGSLYVAGTEKGKGWRDTQVKPEIFTDKDGVRKVAMEFNKEANEMAKVAASGDAAAVKAQLAKVSDACKGCHKDYRIEEKH